MNYRSIPLTQGKVAIVDAEDYERLYRFKWLAWKSPDTGHFYAMRAYRHADGKKGTVAMHREILGLTYGDGKIGDHIVSENTLDNRRSNLRIADPSQSSANQHIRSDNTSGFKGACWDKRKGKWMSYIDWRGKRRFLGYFHTAQQAHSRYCEAAKELHGEFARLY